MSHRDKPFEDDKLEDTASASKNKAASKSFLSSLSSIFRKNKPKADRTAVSSASTITSSQALCSEKIRRTEEAAAVSHMSVIVDMSNPLSSEESSSSLSMSPSNSVRSNCSLEMALPPRPELLPPELNQKNIRHPDEKKVAPGVRPRPRTLETSLLQRKKLPGSTGFDTSAFSKASKHSDINTSSIARRSLMSETRSNARDARNKIAANVDSLKKLENTTFQMAEEAATFANLSKQLRQKYS